MENNLEEREIIGVEFTKSPRHRERVQPEEREIIRVEFTEDELVDLLKGAMEEDFRHAKAHPNSEYGNYLKTFMKFLEGRLNDEIIQRLKDRL